MDSTATQALTLAEAKVRLREAAAGVGNIGTSTLPAMDPRRAALLALLAGILLGTHSDSRKDLAKVLMSLLLDRNY